MLIARVDVQVRVHFPANLVLWQHASYGHLKDALWVLFEQQPGCCKPLTTGVARVAYVDLVGHFLARQTHLFGVDDDYVIATVDMGREVGLVFAANHRSNLAGQPTQDLPLCVNHNPVLLHRIIVGGDGFITECIHCLY